MALELGGAIDKDNPISLKSSNGIDLKIKLEFIPKLK